jgi:hypothetical protein
MESPSGVDALARPLGFAFLDGERNRNMSSRLIFSVCPGTPARRVCAVGAVLAGLAAIGSTPAAAAATPNVCRITGITRAVAKQVFPKLQSVSASQTEAATTPPNFGVCDITPKTAGVASLEVELWSATVFQQQTVTFTNSGKTQRLRRLGKGAFYSPVKGDKDDGSLIFKRGAYTILIYPSSIGGTSADYPNEAKYITLARAIYKHLG